MYYRDRSYGVFAVLKESDYTDLRALWKKQSVIAKILAITLGLLLVSPIASLSDAIFAWRGFFHDGHRAYIDLVATPFIDYLGRQDLSYSVSEIEILAIWSIQQVNCFRFIRLIKLAPRPYAAKAIGMVWVSTLFLLIVAIDYARAGSTLKVGEYGALILLGFFTLTGLLFSLLADGAGEPRRGDRMSEEEFFKLNDGELDVFLADFKPSIRFNYQILFEYFTPVVLALALVLILGAFNEAFSRAIT